MVYFIELHGIYGAAKVQSHNFHGRRRSHLLDDISFPMIEKGDASKHHPVAGFNGQGQIGDQTG